MGISIEIVDPQTLMPFDTDQICAGSLSKTNKLLVVDEDVPGGGTAFLLQQILETQNGYYHLDGQPKTLSAKAHRPPYGSDGDYFSKPSVDDVVEAVYAMMNESNPSKFPEIFQVTKNTCIRFGLKIFEGKILQVLIAHRYFL